MKKRLLLACLIGGTLAAGARDELADAFRTPPDSARPLTWWHWLDGNITREGITADLEAMQRIGLGGTYMFNAGVGMPQGSARFLQPEWLAMLDHAVREAQRLGLKFGVHNCDGFSQSGGPWITPATSMKELTWTATDVQGPAAFDAILPRPETKEDFYRDIAVIAYPLPAGERLSGPGTGTTVHGSRPPAELAKLCDGQPETRAVFPVPAGSNTIEFVFAKPQTVRSLVCRNTAPHHWEEDFPIQMSVSSDGQIYRDVGRFTANWDMIGGGAVTVACEDAPGTHFRLTFSNPWPVNFGEIELSSAARVHFAEAKASRLRSRGHGAERRHHDAYPGPDRTRALPAELVVARDAVQVLTTQLAADGRLKWKAPAGHWRIVRLGFTSNGHYVAPATPEGRGLECDKLDAKLVQFHLGQYVGKLLQLAGPAAGKTFAAMEVDSWECGIQNWTAGFERRFHDRQGYDLLPFMPALLEGWVVDNADVTERALWDWRRFLADQYAENYFSVVAKFAKERNLTYVAEPTGRQAYHYDAAYARHAAVPMGEFWIDKGAGQGVRVDCKLSASIAHTTGKQVVAGESYTAGPQAARWQNHPFSLKPEGDRAFCAGVNEFIFHTFAHQPYRTTGPGFTFASWGLNFNRGNTWWEVGRPWIEYLTRCNHLLRAGQPAADVLWFIGEDVPNRIGWGDELHPALPAGYDFDGCDAQSVLDAHVEKSRIVLAGGPAYRVLLLPNLATMRPALLQKIGELVAAGATVLGPRPQQSPSLRDLGAGDAALRKLADELWNGKVQSGLSFEELFKRIGLPPDFAWTARAPEAEVLVIHRRVEGAEVYFVSNQRSRVEEVSAVFRVGDRAPELWDPATGAITRPGVFRVAEGRTTLPLRLEPNGSVFVVFRGALPARHVVAVEPEPSAAAAALVTAPEVQAAQGTFTLSLWVKPDEDTPLPEARKAPVALRGQNWAVFAEQGQHAYGEGHAGCGLGVGRNGVCVLEHSVRYAPAVITHAAELKDWTHVALVYADGVPQLFVNGVAAGRGAKGPFVVHASAAPVGPAFQGQRSPVQLFDRALAAAEIAALATRPPSGSQSIVPPLEVERTADGKLFARCWTPDARTVVFNDGTRAEIKPGALAKPVEVAGPWQVGFPPNLGAPASAQFEKLISLSQHADPGIRFFSGTATYRTSFMVDGSWLMGHGETSGASSIRPSPSTLHHLFLDLGDVAVIAAVKLNGRDLGILWKPPFRVEVTDVLQAGANELEIRVTSLWPNRMIGDAALPDDVDWNRDGRKGNYPAQWPDWLVKGTPRPSGRITFCTRKDVYAKDEPLLPSGLLGPVLLRAVENMELK